MSSSAYVKQLVRRGLFGGGALMLAAAAVLMPQFASVTPPSRPAPAVQDVIAAAGLVNPLSEEIAAANVVQGVLTKVPFVEGDRVRAGDIVAEIEHADFEAAHSLAMGQLELRRAELEKLLNGARPEERREAVANLNDAEAILSMREAQLKRQTPLAAKGVASMEAFDQAQSNAASALARRNALAERAALINAPPRAEDVAIARANVKQAEAAVQQAKAMLDKTYIRAPIDGTVLRVLRHAGEAVSQTVPATIVIIGDISRLRVIAEIDESDIGRIEIGQRAYVTADAFPGRRSAGTVTRMAYRMGKKEVHTDDPAQKIDAKVQEATIDLDPDVQLPVGLRVDVFVEVGSIGRAGGRVEKR